MQTVGLHSGAKRCAKKSEMLLGVVMLQEIRRVRKACVEEVKAGCLGLWMIREVGLVCQQQSSPGSSGSAGAVTPLTLLCDDWVRWVESALGRTAKRPQGMRDHCLVNAGILGDRMVLALASFVVLSRLSQV